MSEMDRSEHMRLREFAQYILSSCSWGGGVDGGDAQDKAEELGIIELRPIKPEDSIGGENEHYFCKWVDREDKKGNLLG